MTTKRGGQRPGAGGLVQSVTLHKEDWQTLRTILLARYGKADKATVNAFFAGIIRQDDAGIRRHDTGASRPHRLSAEKEERL